MSKEVIKRRRLDVIDAVEQAVDDIKVIDEGPIKDWISTGCTVLDLAISNRYPGGIPLGRTVRIYGGESTCKTVLGMTILGSVQRKGGIAFFIDTERTFDPVWAKLFGLKCSDLDIWRYGCWWNPGKVNEFDQPETVEDLFDEYINRIVSLDDPRPKVIIVDSLTALPSKVEIEGDLGDASYGTTRAKQIGAGLRKYNGRLSSSNTSLIFIDQSRDAIGLQFGSKEVTSGGRAPKFYSSVIIHLRDGGKVTNKKKIEVGVWVNFKIVKNKAAPPFRKSSFKIIWNYGLDDVGTNLDFLKFCQELSGKEGARKSGRVLFDDKNMFMSQMIMHVEEDNLEEKLEKEVFEKWTELYSQEERKQRKWK